MKETDLRDGILLDTCDIVAGVVSLRLGMKRSDGIMPGQGKRNNMAIHFILTLFLLFHLHHFYFHCHCHKMATEWQKAVDELADAEGMH